MDLQHIRLRAVDAKGRTVLTYQDELTFSVSGDAQIVAVTNGDINSHELNVTNHRSLWQGQAMVILRAGTTPSNITLTTAPKTFKSVTTKLQTK
jgi:beta-galactosidase